jgi:Protoheme ferro-lyase (ferrochelatase)
MKHSPPWIAEGVAQMRDDGIERAVGIVMAPHWSAMSIPTYADRVEAAIAPTAARPSRSSGATTIIQR